MSRKSRRLDGTAPTRVQFERATVTRSGRRILDNATLTLEPGTLTVVVGASGSGKTTLLDLAAGLAPTDGVVKFDNTPVRDLPGDKVPRGTTVVTSTPFLVAAPIRHNLALGAAYGEPDLWEALRVAAVDDLVRALPDGLDTVIGEHTAPLRPQVGLARAILRRPRLLVLDDVTAALDPTTERLVLAGLAALDSTVLATTSRTTAAEVADQVVLLEAGRITGVGAAAELLKNVYAAAR